MWWCCGKRGKDSAGCKFNKHESKDDDYNDQNQKELEKLKILKNLKCACCKELGHSISNCTKDPNIITFGDLEEESERIQSIKHTRRMHVDAAVSTTHFIKKSVLVPIQEVNEGIYKEPKNT